MPPFICHDVSMRLGSKIEVKSKQQQKIQTPKSWKMHVSSSPIGIPKMVLSNG